MYSVLSEIRQRLGFEKFPLIPLNYYSSHKYTTSSSSSSPFFSFFLLMVPYEAFQFPSFEWIGNGISTMAISPDMPAVIKVSHAHAGMGKIKVDDSSTFRDMSTVLALHHDYCTAEVRLGSSLRVCMCDVN